MLTEPDNALIGRLRAVVDAGLQAPPDLAWAALLELERIQSTAAERRRQRDEHIIRAAALLGGSPAVCANALLKESRALDRVWGRVAGQPPELNTVRGELHAAALSGKLPSSARQFANILR